MENFRRSVKLQQYSVDGDTQPCALKLGVRDLNILGLAEEMPDVALHEVDELHALRHGANALRGMLNTSIHKRRRFISRLLPSANSFFQTFSGLPGRA